MREFEFNRVARAAGRGRVSCRDDEARADRAALLHARAPPRHQGAAPTSLQEAFITFQAFRQEPFDVTYERPRRFTRDMTYHRLPCQAAAVNPPTPTPFGGFGFSLVGAWR